MTAKMRSLVAVAAISLCVMPLCAVIGARAFAQAAAPAAALAAPDPQEARAGRADRLRTILQLRPAQEPALQSYLTALDAVNRRMKALAGPTPATMPERVARMQHIMAEGKSAMDVVADATRRFYDQLDPGQKRAIDALPMQAVMHGEKPALGMAGGVLTGLDPLAPTSR